MTGLLRAWFRTHWRSNDQAAVEIEALTASLKATQEWQYLMLEEMRSGLAMMIAWRLSMETPEIDHRDDVDAMIRKQEDRIALLSERVP